VEEFYDLYSLPNILRAIKSGTYGTDGGEEMCVQGFGWET